MIHITKLATGILVQRDAIELFIDAPAVPLALGPIIHELVDSGRTAGLARKEGYEAGLLDGRERARIEAETSGRIAERQAADLTETLESAAYALTF